MRKQGPSVDAVLIAVRAKCMECSCDSRREVRNCRIKDCPLYPYRDIEAIGLNTDKPIKEQISIFDYVKNGGENNEKGKEKA